MDHKKELITHADGSRGVGYSAASVCLFIQTISQKPLQCHITYDMKLLQWPLSRKTVLDWGSRSDRLLYYVTTPIQAGQNFSWTSPLAVDICLLL